MSTLTPEQKGDLAEQMLPVAAHLAVLVHGDGGPEDIRQVLEGLDETQKSALIVVLAGLVDPDQPVGKALDWLDFNEHGSLTVPSWSEDRRVRDLAPEPAVGLEDDYIDEVAVRRFVQGFGLESLSDAEFLEAVKRCVAAGMTLPDVDNLRCWPPRTAENWVNRLRKRYQRHGLDFPSLAQPDIRVLTEVEVVAIRERSAAGESDLDIAISFGITSKTVGSVCRGQSYAQYGGPVRAARQVQHLKGTRDYMCGHAKNSQAGRSKSERKAA